jgi:signal transduction histidine kinase
MLFDGLRSDGKLPEQPEWRRWKESMLSAYRAVDPQEHWWHLPDSRTLRVVANPHPQGGVTWFFENMTEKFDLESRYNTLMKVQGETLDHLAEGVAVFGADGRIRLSNPAFAELWSIPPTIAVEGTHISVIRKQCKELADDRYWDEFVSAVTGIADKREGTQGQAELSTGTILSYAVVPLPKGQMMLTFVDVSDTVHVERALKDKNEALELADQIKNDFVQHVSYELRSPLTNIIGFTELLQTPGFGELNNRQREYVEHISTSSLTLLTIVNDILDLATVDAGIMELDVSDVSVRDAVTAASERVADRLREHDIALKVRIEDAVTSFRGDANRVHQVLFNLLSNAANYAPEGSEVSLDIRRRDEHIVFSVHDNGPGMPKEVLDTVFKRFQSHSNGGRRRGAGLGLSLVKSFVELHGGTVDIRTAPSSGTTVLVRFPLDARIYRTAAE